MDDYIWIQIPKLSFEPKFKRGRTTGSKYQHKNIQSQNLGFKGSFIFGDQARAPNTTQRVFSLHWLLIVSKRPQIMDFRLLTTSMFGQGAIVHDLWTKKHGVAIGIVTISGYWLCTAVNKRLKCDEGAKIYDQIMNNLEIIIIIFNEWWHVGVLVKMVDLQNHEWGFVKKSGRFRSLALALACVCFLLPSITPRMEWKEPLIWTDVKGQPSGWIFVCVYCN